LNCPAGRRRTRLSLSAYDLELSLEYARLLKVVQLVLTLLRTRKISTMRDVYYMDCRLFQSQTKSDRSIELLARCFNTPRYGLNIVSFSRGILCGAILLKEKDGQWMDCSSSPVTMPSCMHTIEINADNTSAVFVLEKECIFRRLINDNFVERQYSGKALLVTACGFPDVQTRMLLNRLSSKYPALPIYGIADFDPYGELHPHPRVFLNALSLSSSSSSSLSLSRSLSLYLPSLPFLFLLHTSMPKHIQTCPDAYVCLAFAPSVTQEWRSWRPTPWAASPERMSAMCLRVPRYGGSEYIPLTLRPIRSLPHGLICHRSISIYL
jgi:hypothetical protein